MLAPPLSLCSSLTEPPDRQTWRSIYCSLIEFSCDNNNLDMIQKFPLFKRFNKNEEEGKNCIKYDDDAWLKNWSIFRSSTILSLSLRVIKTKGQLKIEAHPCLSAYGKKIVNDELKKKNLETLLSQNYQVNFFFFIFVVSKLMLMIYEIKGSTECMSFPKNPPNAPLFPFFFFLWTKSF